MIAAGVKSRKELTHTCETLLKPLQDRQLIDPRRPYTYEEWKRQLILVTKQVAPTMDFTINDDEAIKCFDSGMSVWQTFRENFRMV